LFRNRIIGTDKHQDFGPYRGISVDDYSHLVMMAQTPGSDSGNLGKRGGSSESGCFIGELT
jgi:hypothetical protein